MAENIDIWLVGNTGLRSPNRIQEGFRVYAESSFVGNFRGRAGEIGFMNLLNERGIIHNETGKDASGSHARKWRLMFAKNGLIYPQLKKADGAQASLGTLDAITPFGRTFLMADTYPAMQECFLRAMSVAQFPLPEGGYFSPLRWVLALMLELERHTGSSEISRIEFALWVQTTTPQDDLSDVVDHILELRARRQHALSKKKFDRMEIAQRAEHYAKKSDNFLDYADMNMRYLRITGILQRRGRGLMILPTKHVLAEQLARSSVLEDSLLHAYQTLCAGAPLPTDDVPVARKLLDELQKLLKERHIAFEPPVPPLETAMQINIARQRLEQLLAQTDEVQYASRQCHAWREISDYMTLILGGGGKKIYDEDNAIEVPKDELPVYLEWVLWRAILAINHLTTMPYEVRGFKMDADFMPISTAGGGKGDLYSEFDDFAILTEVTISSSSRQEAMEGEPVRRHVSDAVLRWAPKPVYGLFIAVKIDTNTAETFRHGIWYTKEDARQELQIVPLTLAQYQQYFDAMFISGTATPMRVRELLHSCAEKRAEMDAPAWKRHIGHVVQRRTQELRSPYAYESPPMQEEADSFSPYGKE
ncbi:hypothetical protein TAMA11512_00910 [Selenomonas sp. TAMA-11512]|uniref:AlwI family type II restriction endonuclease n=1 Tax=Selenomonas sp. TAMA-11512 TaxID=3095337 RepID=UPI0030895707|nr:hypothetical protein TAMA11512_00910 [Selenomonas sp. TAMA-11512]